MYKRHLVWMLILSLVFAVCAGAEALPDDALQIELSGQDETLDVETPEEAPESLLPLVREEAAALELVPPQSTEASGEVRANESIYDTAVTIDEDHFPDPAFRRHVRDNYDRNDDGALSEQEISWVTACSPTGKGIESLQGIEYLTALRRLDCRDNALTELDNTVLRRLTELVCRDNRLTFLDLDGCDALTNLDCAGNRLTDLNLSGCTALEDLICFQNSLTDLDVRCCPQLAGLDCSVNQLEGLNLGGCGKLTELECSHNKLTTLHLDDCTALETLDCDDNALSFLIADRCALLEHLSCIDNQLTLLNVSGCNMLKNLVCYRNRLPALDVSKNAALSTLSCFSNQLTALDVSQNTALTGLYCQKNRITALDVRRLSLQELYCHSNELTVLRLGKHSDLAELYCYDNESLQTLDVSQCPRIVQYVSEEYYRKGTVDGIPCVMYGEDTEGLRCDEALQILGGDPVPSPVSLAGASVTVKAKAYTGKALKPPVTVKLDGKTLKKGTDYTVSYKNNTNVGKATVVITGKGGYTGTAKAAFRINPAKVTGLTLTAGKKKLTVAWKQAGGAGGYEVQYSLKKSFSDAKTRTVKKAATLKTVLKSLKARKTYWVRVRAFKTVKKVKYVSTWSAVKKLKTK
ncbi:MAG: fibronectin type III domain-containing protein [Clostridia bacterium]|nr:fibronectin type III domain-containing protein [Clostridia bacterium]